MIGSWLGDKITTITIHSIPHSILTIGGVLTIGDFTGPMMTFVFKKTLVFGERLFVIRSKDYIWMMIDDYGYNARELGYS